MGEVDLPNMPDDPDQWQREENPTGAGQAKSVHTMVPGRGPDAQFSGRRAGRPISPIVSHFTITTLW
ncbi:hypothetical protein PG996_007039 [Apiospora saccharicola]|uniref:Uncharacterized protein n=1 Tax=Apiospora saccharicola TaxID=335842 RepID=A0ABR1VAK5_9PEZI